jgi:DNA topoisomerase-3
MSTLVRHFGDLADSRTDCGICDFCAPERCVAQRFRTATEGERTALLRVIEGLRAGERKSTGKLHAALFPHGEMLRDAFEDVLGAMARAGLARLSDATFEKDGKKIPYRTVRLTETGLAADATTPIDFVMKDGVAATAPRKRKKKTAAREKPTPRTGKVAAAEMPKRKRVPAREDSRVEEALRAWRLKEARKRGVPAFRIFTDKALRAIAEQRPATAAELLAIPGIGISSMEKYGQQIYRILEQAG